MAETPFTILIQTELSLTPDQRRYFINTLAQEIKKFEWNERLSPRGNIISRAFVKEQSDG